MTVRFGINTGFATNRFSEPEEWTRVVNSSGIKYVQFTADLLNVSMPRRIIDTQTKRILKACRKNNIKVLSTFTSAFTRVNHLAHPDKDIRNYWIGWFKRFAELTIDLDSNVFGSHFGIFTNKDNSNPSLREMRRQQNIECWHEVGEYAKSLGIDHILWEPMSISREQGETLEACYKLQEDVNVKTPIPFKICLDVDHGDATSGNPKDVDYLEWIRMFKNDSSCIHLKQSSDNKGGHWPFTKEHNAEGKIQPLKIMEELNKSDLSIDLMLELSFKERDPIDSNVEKAINESAEYWGNFVTL